MRACLQFHYKTSNMSRGGILPPCTARVRPTESWNCNQELLQSMYLVVLVREEGRLPAPCPVPRRALQLAKGRPAPAVNSRWRGTDERNH